MKNNILTLLLCLIFLAPSLSAEESAGRGISAGIMFGVSPTHLNKHSDNESMIINPRIGYNFNNKWESGFLFKNENTYAYNYKYWGIYTDYNYISLKNDQLNLFVDFSASMVNKAYQLLDFYPGMKTSKYRKHFYEIGFTPGLAY